MSSPTELHDLSDLPPHERREIIEDVVVGQLRSALLMEPDEDLPLDAGFFELGLTSLRLGEIKRSLEQILDRELDTSVLFTKPTAGQLIDYLSASA